MKMQVPDPIKLPSGSWRVRVSVGKKRVSITRPTKTECLKQAQLLKAEYQAGKRIEPTRKPMTLGGVLDEYITRKEHTLSPATIRGYQTIRRSRFQVWMGRDITRMSADEWRRMTHDEACGPKTLRNSIALVRTACQDVAGITVPKLDLPAIVPNEHAFLSYEDIPVFIASVKDTPYAVPLLLLLSSLRLSELTALQWESLPKGVEFIPVRGAVVPDSAHKLVYKPTNKTTSSTRMVPILIPELSDALDRDRRPSGPVLQCSQSALRRAADRICTNAGLPVVGLHGLRHSFASLAYHLRIPEQITMQIGGWSDYGTMRKIYTHVAARDMTTYQGALRDFFRSNTDTKLDTK